MDSADDLVAGPDRAVYRVAGVVQEEFVSGQAKTIIRSFDCRVDDKTWRIELAVTSDNAAEKRRFGTNVFFIKPADAEVASSDGTNFYVVNRSDFSGALERDGIGGTLGEGAAARMGPGSVPFGLGEPLLVIWYSFASSDYLRQRSAGVILPMHSVTFEDVKVTNHLVSARWQLLPDSPQLPESIVMSNYFTFDSIPNDLKKSSFPHTNVDFHVLETTNYLGLTIPTRVSVDYFFHRREGGAIKALRFKRVEVTVDRILPPTGNIALRPQLPEGAMVTDMRYWLSNPPIPVWIRASNGWPRNAVFAATYGVRADFESRKHGRGYFRAAILAIVLGPPLALVWYLMRNKLNTTIQRKRVL